MTTTKKDDDEKDDEEDEARDYEPTTTKTTMRSGQLRTINPDALVFIICVGRGCKIVVLRVIFLGERPALHCSHPAQWVAVKVVCFECPHARRGWYMLRWHGKCYALHDIDHTLQSKSDA